MRRYCGWLVVLVALVVSGTGQAQSQNEPDNPAAYWETLMWDARMRIALPSWVDEAALLLPSSQARRNRKDLIAIMEFIPATQGFDNWQTMLKVRGERVGSTGDLAMGQIVAVQVRALAGICMPGKFQAVPVANHPQVVVTLVLCGQYKPESARLGLGTEKGSAFIMRITKSQAAILTVHQEWRNQPFDPAVRDSWPVSREELAKMINRFAGMAIRQMPAQQQQEPQQPAAPTPQDQQAQ